MLLFPTHIVDTVLFLSHMLEQRICLDRKIDAVSFCGAIHVQIMILILIYGLIALLYIVSIVFECVGAHTT